MKTRLMTALFIFLGAALLPAAGWPQWRGPTRDGQFTGVAWPDKLDTNHLQRIWRTLTDKGGMWGSVFSSPVFAELAGQRQLLVQTREKLAGVEPADGKVLWEQPVEAFRGMNILTPVVHQGTLFTSTYGGKTIGFKTSP